MTATLEPAKQKALQAALDQIDRSFGKGIMRLGEVPTTEVGSIPTGSLSLDLAIGIGGVPRGRIVEVYGPESSGKTTLALSIVANAQKAGGVAAFIDAEHALDPEVMPKKLALICKTCWCLSQFREQALDICDTSFVRTPLMSWLSTRSRLWCRKLN